MMLSDVCLSVKLMALLTIYAKAILLRPRPRTASRPRTNITERGLGRLKLA